MSLSIEGNSTVVTAKKEGTTIVTYSSNGASASVTLTIKASELPDTGQDNSAVLLMLAVSGVLALCACLLRRKSTAR